MDMQIVKIIPNHCNRFSLQHRVVRGRQEWTVVDAEFVPTIRSSAAWDGQGDHIAYRSNSEDDARRWLGQLLASMVET